MAIILPNSVFYHIPKTGGQWVSAVLRNLGLLVRDYSQDLPMDIYNLRMEHVSPSDARKEVVRGKFSFAFIRNPVTWYQSFWRYKKVGRWDEPYKKVSSDDFNEFVKNMMDSYPGFLTNMYKKFDSVDFLGKQENLRGDLAAALTAAGEKFSLENIKTTIEIGGTPKDLPTNYEPNILKRLKKLEKWIFKKYYPESL